MQTQSSFSYQYKVHLYDKNGYRHPVVPERNYELICQFCGKTFNGFFIRRKYCSYRCRNDAHIKRRKYLNTLNRNKHCLFCGLFFVAKSKKAKFCCLKHRVAYFRKVQQHTKEKSLPISNDTKLSSNETNLESLQNTEEVL